MNAFAKKIASQRARFGFAQTDAISDRLEAASTSRVDEDQSMKSRAGRLTRPEGQTSMLDDVTLSESLLRRSYAFERFGAAAAVLDSDGVIVETNEAWRLFAALNAGALEATGCGVSYLSTCDRAFASGSESTSSTSFPRV